MAQRRQHRPRGRPREKSEFDQKVLDIRRVARVMKGGRRFSFRATVVVGNLKGKVGVGVARGPDVTTAVEKAVYQAKKHIVTVPITGTGTIRHEIEAKFSAARVLLKPRLSGGLVAGGAVRAVSALAGVKHISAKVLSRTPNKLTTAMAALEAFRQLKAD